MAETYENLAIPPHDIGAERDVLGGLMMNNQAADQVFAVVGTDDFYQETHRLIFRALLHLSGNKKPLDIRTVSHFLEDRGKLEDAGGFAYLGTLAKDTPSAANVVEYAEIVANKSVLRQVAAVAQEIFSAAFNAPSDAEGVRSLLDESVAKMFALELKRARGDQSLVPLKPVLRERLETIQKLASERPENGQRPLLGVSTGLDALDRRYSGLQPGKVYVIGGRPGKGKTTLGLNIVEHVGIQHPDQLSVVFSAEMQKEELADKFMASAGRVQFNRVRDPWDITDDDWPGLAMGVKRLSGANIYLDDQGGYTVGTIRGRARRLMHETGLPLGVLMIDYLQLLRGERRSYPNRNEEVGEISRACKQLSKDLNTPILLLSQLSRAVTNRASGAPVLSDLRESGDIEQDADVVLFVHRPDEAGDNTAELISAKVRAGETGTDQVIWNGQYQRFDAYAPEAAYEGDYV